MPKLYPPQTEALTDITSCPRRTSFAVSTFFPAKIVCTYTNKTRDNHRVLLVIPNVEVLEPERRDLLRSLYEIILPRDS